MARGRDPVDVLTISPRLRFLLAASVYMILARFAAEALALPPGYSTSLWPAAGWALWVATKFGIPGLLGIACGSIANNTYADPSWFNVPIGVCAGLQAGAATLLWRAATAYTWSAKPAPPIKEPMCLGALLFAGITTGAVPCAVVGPSMLKLSGKLDPVFDSYGALVGALPPNWAHQSFNWWFGDALGIAVMLPLCVFLLEEK